MNRETRQRLVDYCYNAMPSREVKLRTFDRTR